MKSQLTCIICNQKLSAKTTEHKCNYRNNLKIDDLKIDTVNK